MERGQAVGCERRVQEGGEVGLGVNVVFARGRGAAFAAGGHCEVFFLDWALRFAWSIVAGRARE